MLRRSSDDCGSTKPARQCTRSWCASHQATAARWSGYGAAANRRHALLLLQSPALLQSRVQSQRSILSLADS